MKKCCKKFKKIFDCKIRKKKSKCECDKSSLAYFIILFGFAVIIFLFFWGVYKKPLDGVEIDVDQNVRRMPNVSVEIMDNSR